MNLKPLLFIPPIALAVFGFMKMNETVPTEPAPKPETRLAVRTFTLAEKPANATAIGYGRVEPVHEWTAVAEVQGRMEDLQTDLAVGSIVEAGSTLFSIDATDYELAREKAVANIASVEAQLAELDGQEGNTRNSLELEERVLAVAQAEYDRVKALVDRGTSTQAALDKAEKTLLAQSTAITNLRNTQALYPSKRQSLEATLKVRKADLADAERSIAKTRVTAPFKARVSALNIEQGQFVRLGDKVLELQDISAAEITAELQPAAFAPMISLALRNKGSDSGTIDTTQAVSIFRDAGITAQVVSETTTDPGRPNARWPAEIVRMRGTLDSTTGALGLIVRVDDPLISSRAQSRPPLNVGAFVSVQFSSPQVDNILAIPRQSVRYDDIGAPFAYVVGDDARLAKTALTLGAVLGDEVIVRDGLAPGDTLILTNPQPPVLGMALDIVPANGGN
ncbi:HlyD family efflux transporter periplasmic adaptor subunit [Alisedimentitalea sp. MJ-SS2]|uniref:efflux RND transporter periplasmic adaptor subunit n=1 Tax=Aliisedimentitalea sp. MJ-SS2 TaxID=3049795 RepID=UPI0029065E8B|nr:HlyD family efflux transporter periplasmic adaptor subunit [Alisedimentitalea sp. MJ-SS2]MDU8925830.1 HlyD family efflux transporter periplasmic adaptor subunit [Alisedimentitalea sp. MJ-SS2]